MLPVVLPALASFLLHFLLHLCSETSVKETSVIIHWFSSIILIEN